MASKLDCRASRILLGLWLVAIFAFSACSDPRLLSIGAVIVGIVFWRGLARAVTRLIRFVMPVTIGLILVSLTWLRLRTGAWPAFGPYAALFLRTSTIALLTFSVLERVDLLGALTPLPTLSRLLVVTLAQIHVLRLLATESLQGFQSRTLRQPRVLDVARNASGVTAALLTLSLRNGRDLADALRSRGF